MKKNLFSLLIITLFSGLIITSCTNNRPTTIYDFTVKAIDGSEYDLSQLEGKKVIIVNVASRCGLTPQYKQLQELYEKYSDKGFTIVAFPANNFMEQEPGSDSEIKEFCEVNYGVKFPMMSKISVAGDDIAPLYKWLTEKQQNGVLDTTVVWNFHKFLIGKDGKLVKTLHPQVEPLSKEIIEWIEAN